MRHILNFVQVVLSTLILLALHSCRKDITEVDSNCYCCGDSNPSGQIECGNLDGMNVLTPDTLLEFGSNSGFMASFLIDLDNDNVHDFEIKHTVAGSYTSGPKPYTQIISLDSTCKVSINPFADTIYAYTTHLYYGTNPVYYTITNHASCIANSESDSIISISDELRKHELGDLISFSDTWSSGTFFFRNYNFHMPGEIGAPVNDTVTIIEYDSKKSCLNVPNDVDLYVGIKKMACGEEKLGWIKLRFHANTLFISEYAIQK